MSTVASAAGASVFGDFVYRKSAFVGVPSYINHAATLWDSTHVTDVNTGRGNTALRTNAPLSTFDHGARRIRTNYTGAPVALSSAKQTALKARINYCKSYDTEYDGAHNNQKGAFFEPWFEDDYWEFDCVGFNERIYEDIGFNPTIDEGNNLWPDEQRDSPRLSSF